MQQQQPSSSPSSSSSSLVHTYCTAHGLVSGVQYNGKECFVAKVDPNHPDRFAVIFTEMLSKPDFVSLKPQNLTKKVDVEVKCSSLPDGGLGVFATRDYAAGEIILTEKPFLELSDDLSQTTPTTTPSSYAAIVARHAPSKPVLEVLETLTLQPRSVHTMETARGGDWALRFGNNAIDAATPAPNMGSLYPLLCRINSTCLYGPSLNAVWDLDSHRTLTAVRPIRSGEEIFVEYCSNHLNPEARRTALARYGIRMCPSASELAERAEVDALDAAVENGESVVTTDAVATGAPTACAVCNSPDAHKLFAAFNKSIMHITKLTGICGPPITGNGQFPPVQMVVPWIDAAIKYSKECDALCDQLTALVKDSPLAGQLARDPRSRAQIPLLSMLFQVAVSYQLKESATTLSEMLLRLFESQIEDQLRQHGGNAEHPLYVRTASTIGRSIANTKEFMKHVR